MERVKEETFAEEKIQENKCVCCKATIIGKPWITVCFDEDDYTVHACNYSCASKLKYQIGIGYWDNVVNKEDFDTHLIPVETFNNKSKKDITTNFQRDEIIDEILQEEKRINDIEKVYDYSSEDYVTEDDY